MAEATGTVDRIPFPSAANGTVTAPVTIYGRGVTGVLGANKVAVHGVTPVLCTLSRILPAIRRMRVARDTLVCSEE
jgi:hypothetical protein